MTNNQSRPDIVWIDGVGGLALAISDSLTIGRQANLSIVGSLPQSAGTLVRRGEDWFWMGGDEMGDQDSQLLTDDAVLPLPGGVQCVLRRPSFLTATRRLDLLRPHRWSGGVDAVLLISKIATIGPTQSDSVCASHLEHTHFLSTLDDPMTIRCEKEHSPLMPDGVVTVGELTMMVRPWDV